MPLSVPEPTDRVNPATDKLVEKLQAVQEKLHSNLQQAQERYKRKHNLHTRPAPDIKVGDKVWLHRWNIRTTRPSQKFDMKWMGPFQVLEAVGNAKFAYNLELPAPMRIHPVFHISLLEPYRKSMLPRRVQAVPQPIKVKGELEYEVARISDSKIERWRLKYLVDWAGYGPEERMWEPAENVVHAADAVTDFHRDYPLRPSPKDQPHQEPQSRRGPYVTNGRQGVVPHHSGERG